MNILRVSLKNHGSHAATDWSPNGARLVSLVGANGAGKSLLIEAIGYALFDDGRASGQDLVRLGSTDMSVRIEFGFGGQVYAVERGRTTRSGGKSYLEFQLQDGTAWRPLTGETIRDTEAAIAALLRMDAATFRTAALLEQGHANAFAEATAGERKRILGTVLGLDRYARVEARAREHARDLEARSSVQRDQVARADEQLAGWKEIEGNRDQARVVLATAEADLAGNRSARNELDERITALDGELATARALGATVDALATRVAELRDAWRAALGRAGGAELLISRSETALADAPRIAAAAASLPALQADVDRLVALERQALALDAEIRNRKDAIAEQKRTADVTRATWQARYEAARSRVDELTAAHHALRPVICEKCGHGTVVDQAGIAEQLDVASRAYRTLEAERPAGSLMLDRELAQIAMRQSKREALKWDPAELIAAQGPLRVAEQTAALADRMATAEQTKADAEATLAAALEEKAAASKAGETAAAELRAVQAQQAAADPLRQEREQLARRRGELVTEGGDLEALARTATRVLAAADAALENLEKVATERERVAAVVDAAASELALLRRLVVAFGATGIPARIIESVLPELSAYANELLAELRPDMTLEIRAQRAKRDGSGVVEALDLVVRDEAGERGLALFSGGERMSVSLAIAVALSRLVARRAGTAIRTLVVDEPDGLDADARRSFGQALRILANHGELERVVLVSHHADLAEVADAVYQVTKGGAGSVVSQIA